MSSRKDDSTPKEPTSKPQDPSPLDPSDDQPEPYGPGSSYGYNITRGSYMELHGDIHKGQEPPEEKD